MNGGVLATLLLYSCHLVQYTKFEVVKISLKTSEAMDKSEAGQD
jgi:hypothetical protein